MTRVAKELADFADSAVPLSSDGTKTMEATKNKNNENQERIIAKKQSLFRRSVSKVGKSLREIKDMASKGPALTVDALKACGFPIDHLYTYLIAVSAPEYVIGIRAMQEGYEANVRPTHSSQDFDPALFLRGAPLKPFKNEKVRTVVRVRVKVASCSRM